jgi:hypothetical protein
LGFWYESLNNGGTITRPVLAKAGSYSLLVASFDDNIGAYSLSSSPIAATSITGCSGIFATQGVTASFSVASGCPYSPASVAGSGFNGFPVYVNMAAGTLRVSVSATAFAPLIEIRDGSGTVLGSSSAQTGSTVTLQVTSTGAAAVWITSRTAGGSGAFSITIDP